MSSRGPAGCGGSTPSPPILRPGRGQLIVCSFYLGPPPRLLVKQSYLGYPCSAIKPGSDRAGQGRLVQHVAIVCGLHGVHTGMGTQCYRHVRMRRTNQTVRGAKSVDLLSAAAGELRGVNGHFQRRRETACQRVSLQHSDPASHAAHGALHEQCSGKCMGMHPLSYHILNISVADRSVAFMS